MLDDHRIFKIGGWIYPVNIDAAHDNFEELKRGLASKYGPAYAVGNTPPTTRFGIKT
jgi:hypothetical protein